MRGAGRQEAFVTVSFCLLITVMGALMLCLLEYARFYGLKEDAGEWTNLALESLFAGYQPVLLEEYGMFFLDGGFGTGTLNLARAEEEAQAMLHQSLSAKKTDAGINLYRMQAEETELVSCLLAADEDGKVFAMQAAKTMKSVIGQRAAKKILEQITEVESKTQQTDKPGEAIKEAQEALDQMKAQQEAANVGKTPDGKPQDKEAAPPAEGGQKNPLEVIKAIKKDGILALVWPKGKTVSEKTVNADHCMMKRARYQGNMKLKETPGWYERILTQEFIKPLAKNAVSPNADGALSYGTEYIICGRESDKENMKGTVKRLLAIREGMNFLYLKTDAAKCAEAAAAAAAIAGLAGSPAVLAIAEAGILAAWAYAESICDVKALLSGGKIPLLKNGACWQTQLSNLAGVLETDYTGEAEGLPYERYLDALLYMKTLKETAYRSMDLMEWHLNRIDGYSQCRMDAMAAGAQLSVRYGADTLFLGIFGKKGMDGYEFCKQAEYIYGR